MSTGNTSDDRKCLRYRLEIERLADGTSLRISGALARHVESCEACRQLLDDVSNVQNLMDKMKWRSMPAGTLALCNRQAMKKLERQIREMPKAKDLAVATPDIPRWQQMTIRLSRGGIGVAAGLAVVIFNMAASGELYRAKDHLQKLAEVHQRQHIGDWNTMDETMT